MEFIRDLLWLWILGALGGTGYIIYAVYVRAAPAPVGGRPPQVVTTRRTPGPPPIARPAGSGLPPVAPVAPARTTPAAGEHQRRGSAPTVKLAAAEGARDASEDQAAADLFGGLSEAKARADAAPPIHVPTPPQLPIPKDIAEQVVRLEERGFHVGAGRTDVPAHPRPSTEGVSPPIKTPDAKPAEGNQAEVPGQARSQTAELDDILKRIDAVLSETNAPQSEATLTGQQSGGQQTMPMPMSPPTEKLDRKATDPNQQTLF
jgi:hypothetical protein